MKAYPSKPPWGHHVHGRHTYGSSVKNRGKFSKFCKRKKKYVNPHFKNLYLARIWV
jgi:hypothetical protein